MRLCMIDSEGGQGGWDTGSGVILRYCGRAVRGKAGGGVEGRMRGAMEVANLI